MTYTPTGCAQDVLFEAIDRGKFGMICLDGPDDRLNALTLRQLGAPYIAVAVANVGPGRYRSARPLRDWCNFAVLHATVEQRTDYAIIADMVARHDKLLLVETSGSIARAWFAFLQQRRPTMGLIGELPR